MPRAASIHRVNPATLPALFTLLLATMGCQQAAQSAAPAAKGPCALLKQSEVAAVFPGAKAGEVDTSREQYGITACVWNTASSRFVAQYWKAVGGSAQDEAKGLMLGVVDPLKPGAANNVRIETVTGVGDQAVAAVETQDEQRGILGDMAMLTVQKGDQILVLMAPELAHMDRAKALAALKSLGSSSASRL